MRREASCHQHGRNQKCTEVQLPMGMAPGTKSPGTAKHPLPLLTGRPSTSVSVTGRDCCLRGLLGALSSPGSSCPSPQDHLTRSPHHRVSTRRPPRS